MCGIFGVISSEGMTNYQKRRAFLENAAVVDSIRGMDSTGILCVDRKTHSKIIYKKDVAGHDFVQMKRVENILRDTDHYGAVVGHNRAATSGSVSVETAHPFSFGHITGVHNGTLRGHYQDLPDAGIPVDSARLFKGIEEEGHKTVFGKIKGSFACVWWDAKKDRLYAIRNSERPLHFATAKSKKTTLFASEKGMLMWLAGRNGIEIEQVYTLKEGVLLEFDLDNPCSPKSRDVKFYTPPKSTTTTNQWAGKGNKNKKEKQKSCFPSNLGPHAAPVGNYLESLAARVSTTDEQLLAGEGFLPGEICRVWLADDDSFQAFPPMPGQKQYYGRCLGFTELVDSKGNPIDCKQSAVLRIPMSVFDNYASVVAGVVGYGHLPGQNTLGPMLSYIRPDELYAPATGGEDDEPTQEEDDGESAEVELMQGPSGLYMKREELESILKKHGNQCQECTADLYVDIDEIHWTSSDTGDVPLCSDCHTKREKDNNVIFLPETKEYKKVH